jgi:hypothetical protein
MKALGISADELAQMSPEQTLNAIADAMARMEDPTAAAGLAQRAFGTEVDKILPLLLQGSKGIENLREQARKLGLTISAEAAARAAKFSDTMNILWKVVKHGVFVVGSALAPLLIDLAKRFTTVAVRISEWIRENKGLIVTVAKIAAATVAVGTSLVVLGTAISGFATIVGGLVTVVTTVVAVLKVLGAVIASLVSPIGLAVAAVGTLGVVLLKTSGVGAQALAWLGEKFNVLKEDALTAYQGIADALAAGDIALAAKILWLSLKMEWTRGVNFLEKVWLNFRNFFIKLGHDAFTGLLAVAENVWHALEVGWIETTAFFARLWTNFTGFFARTWENIKAGAKRAWNWIKSLFDDSIDLQANNRLIEQQRQAAIARIDDDRRRQLAEQQARRKRADDLHEATMAGIGQANLDVHHELDAEYADRMAENERDLAEARRAWQDAIAEARGKREAADAARNDEQPATIPPPEPAFEFDLGAIPGLSDIGQAIKDQAEKIGVTGTFNVAAAFGLGAGSSIDERTANASEETAKNTRHILDAVRSGGLEFA